MKKTILLLSALLLATGAHAQKYDFNGLDMNMGTLSRLSNAKSRSISPENPTGEPGRGGMCPLEEGSARRAARDLGASVDGIGFRGDTLLLVRTVGLLVHN